MQDSNNKATELSSGDITLDNFGLTIFLVFATGLVLISVASLFGWIAG